jgi:serine/threonine protein phosphatase PrpC
MEDEYFIGNGGRFAAVFDGHGGSGVSQFLKNSLYRYFNQALEQKHWEDDNSPGDVPSISSHVAALRIGFEKVERDVMSDNSLDYQGSTAVAVLLHESDDGHRTLLSANVGDSRAVLSRNGKAVELTHDHKPNDEKEKARIMALGTWRATSSFLSCFIY